MWELNISTIIRPFTMSSDHWKTLLKSGGSRMGTSPTRADCVKSGGSRMGTSPTRAYCVKSGGSRMGTSPTRAYCVKSGGSRMGTSPTRAYCVKSGGSRMGTSPTRAYCACIRCALRCWTIFFYFVCYFSSFSLSLGDGPI